MFDNVEELRELIRQGKTNEEIISARKSYLESSNVGNEQQFNGNQAIFYGGYINKSTLISADDGFSDDGALYMVDNIDDLYGNLIDTIRKNIDKHGIPLSIVLKKVKNYFAESETSQYSELIKYMKQSFPNDKYIAREFLPYIIQYYNCSNYDGNITDFGKAFMWNRFGSEEWKKAHSAEIAKYSSSVDWKKAYSSNVCKLSSLKGAGIAACTEMSMVMQNCLVFLGFESYIIAGKLSNGKSEEEHNFNVTKDSQGSYKIVDGAQDTIIKLEDISSPERLLYLDGIEGTNCYGESISYTSYYAPKKMDKKTK